MLRAALVALPVLVPLLAAYLIADPFKVIYAHDDYFPNPAAVGLRVSVNKGMATVRNYERQVAQGRNYNAFIFGSSISCYYSPEEWAEILGADARPYHFDSSSETLVQMGQKAEYLHNRGSEIKYALVVLDPWIMLGRDEDSPFSINPPEVQPSLAHIMKFHYTFFRASMNADFLKSYIYSIFAGEPLEIGRNKVFEDQPIVYDSLTNHKSVPLWDSIIAQDPAGFYAAHPLMPSPATSEQAAEAIDNKSHLALEAMARIFAADGTDYEVIIGPNRRKLTLNDKDLHKLQTIFGASHVHDFSRIWVNELEADTMLYDNVHYRPVFASRLLHAAYDR